MNLESVFVLLESKMIGDMNLLKTGKSLTMIGIIDEQKSSTPTLPSMVKKEKICGKESLVDYGTANDSGSGGIRNITNVSGFSEQVLPSVRTWARLEKVGEVRMRPQCVALNVEECLMSMELWEANL